MFRFTAFVALVCAASTLAAPMPSPEGASTQIVGTVKCAAKPSYSGQLYLDQTSGEVDSITLSQGNVRYLIGNKNNGQVAPKFDFYDCPSTFMGTKGRQSADSHYGQIRSGDKCVRIVEKADYQGENTPKKAFELSTCSYSEDSSQLFQTFASSANGHYIGFVPGQVDSGKNEYDYTVQPGSSADPALQRIVVGGAVAKGQPTGHFSIGRP
ncbi:hypothetical protein IE81DRAFT_319754 [Ceraceosorus guamensis]|uniref:Ricin B lectin domain-containing protein n=1 Tax=Ceraceosorus guamensis TaxID=1522189 RepID=A0A316WB35_9BASI|nr:hypothetical protein IE81DRAFT_319754 [Ceraceosorus guamensis]PWN45911.1 hypothetical protein IE81DRAFT_319754 [Ceraceosorus guamensis]